MGVYVYLRKAMKYGKLLDKFRVYEHMFLVLQVCVCVYFCIIGLD